MKSYFTKICLERPIRMLELSQFLYKKWNSCTGKLYYYEHHGISGSKWVQKMHFCSDIVFIGSLSEFLKSIFYIWKFEKFCVRLEKFIHCLFYIFLNVSALKWTFRIWFRFLQFHDPGNKRIRCPYKVFSWDWKQT